MKLSEVYSPEFIKRLNLLNKDADLDPNEEVKEYINIERILKELKFKVEFNEQMDGSGKISGDTIMIDSSENKERQRFSMAHELGHAMQNVRHANRNDDSNDYSVTDRKDEVFANTFAAQFLMPKSMVVLEVSSSIEKHNYDQKRLTDKNVKSIISDVARKLKVSTMAMKYRMDNLGIFVPVEDK